MWKNLLPQGTRVVELCSAYSLITIGILNLQGTLLPIPELANIDHPLTWALVLLMLGSLQLLSIFNYPKLEILRTILAWASGCFWVWVGITTPEGMFSAEDICVIFLGVCNLYGFIINFNLIQISWTD